MPIWKAGGAIFRDGPHIVGAGVCKTPKDTERWLKAGPVVSGSYTRNPRGGNQGKVMYPETLEGLLTLGYGLNSYGMPNMGFDEARRQLANLPSPLHPLIISIAGFSVDDYVVGVRTFSTLDNVAAIELNGGCPNTSDEERKDPSDNEEGNPNAGDILSFNPIAWRRILKRLVDEGLTSKPIWLKPSYYSNPAELKRVAMLANGFKGKLRLAMVVCNTFANGYAGEGKISSNNGMAGISGPALKPFALGQVRQFREHLDRSIDVIGVGGITTGNDIVDFLDAGAAAVQFVSLAHWAGDPQTCFEHLSNEKTGDRFLKLMDN